MKKMIFVLSGVLALPLIGCASNEELTEQQTQHQTELNEQQTRYESELSNQQLQHETEKEMMQMKLSEKEAELNELQNEMTENKKPSEMTTQYVVKKGDYLSEIAKSAGMPFDEIVRLNPQLKDINLLFVGEMIHISQ